MRQRAAGPVPAAIRSSTRRRNRSCIVSEVYEALREAGASEQSAKAAAGAIPVGQYLASKEDLQKAFGEAKTGIAAMRGEVKTEIAEFRGEIKRELAVPKWTYVAYGPIIMGLLIKIASFVVIKIDPATGEGSRSTVRRNRHRRPSTTEPSCNGLCRSEFSFLRTSFSHRCR